MRHLWRWLLNPDHRGILTLMVTTAAFLVAGVWSIYVHLSKPAPYESKPAISINFQITPEQFENLHKEIIHKYGQADPEKRALLEKELAITKGMFANLQKEYEDNKTKLAEAEKSLENLKRYFPSEKFDHAKKNLTKREKSTAEVLILMALGITPWQEAEEEFAQLMRVQAEYLDLNRKLRIELANLTSISHLEKLATQYGMGPPQPSQIIHLP